MKKITYLAILLLLNSTTIAAPIQFIVTGTADSSDFGYIQGESYSFAFMLNDSYTGGSGDSFSSTHSSWNQSTDSDLNIFTSVTGESLTGTYTPSFAPLPAVSYYALSFGEGWTGEQQLSLIANTDDFSYDIGLKTPNGSDVSALKIELILSDLAFVHSNHFVNPVDAWNPYLGTYAITGSNFEFRCELVGDGRFDFTPTSLAILSESTTVDADVDIFQSIELVFPTISNSSYQVQISSNLVDWVDFETSFQGDGTTNSLHFSTRTTDKQYYRVRETTAP